jgi:hypothetical protein
MGIARFFYGLDLSVTVPPEYNYGHHAKLVGAAKS